MERAFRRGLAAFRWGAWLWIAVTLAIYWHNPYFRHFWLGFALVALALAFTVAQTALLPLSIRFVNRRLVALGELATGVALIAFDGFVRRQGALFENGPTIGSWWPVIGLFSASTYLSPWSAAAGGVLFGFARIAAALMNGLALGDITGTKLLSIAGTGVFAALAAASVSGIMRLLQRAEREMSFAKAREEVARTLHDGVLQTLAVVERRTDDDALARLAREQELELRKYLFETRSESPDAEELGVSLMRAASRFEAMFQGSRANVIVADDLPPVAPKVMSALAGAVGEALTNAGKHGKAKTVTVYVEPGDDDGVFCSVNDNGEGFDVATAESRVGITQSIKGRIEEAGGRVEIRSTPGNGAEVLMWVK